MNDTALDPLRLLITEIVRVELARLAPPMDELMSPEQAARHCGVATGTVRRWIREGCLQRISAGRRVRIRRADLEAMLETPDVRGPRKSRPSPEIAAERANRRRSLDRHK